MQNKHHTVSFWLSSACNAGSQSQWHSHADDCIEHCNCCLRPILWKQHLNGWETKTVPLYRSKFSPRSLGAICTPAMPKTKPGPSTSTRRTAQCTARACQCVARLPKFVRRGLRDSVAQQLLLPSARKIERGIKAGLAFSHLVAAFPFLFIRALHCCMWTFFKEARIVSNFPCKCCSAWNQEPNWTHSGHVRRMLRSRAGSSSNKIWRWYSRILPRSLRAERAENVLKLPARQL